MQRAVVLLKCILKGPQRKFGMNMDQTNEVNGAVRKECAHLALEAAHYRGVYREVVQRNRWHRSNSQHSVQVIEVIGAPRRAECTAMYTSECGIQPCQIGWFWCGLCQTRSEYA